MVQKIEGRIFQLMYTTKGKLSWVNVSAKDELELFSFIAEETLKGETIRNAFEYTTGRMERVPFATNTNYKRILYNLKHERDPEYTVVLGVPCKMWKVKDLDGKRNFAFRFTVPGWEECTTTGLRDTKKVISARLNPVVRNTLGMAY